MTIGSQKELDKQSKKRDFKLDLDSLQKVTLPDLTISVGSSNKHISMTKERNVLQLDDYQYGSHSRDLDTRKEHKIDNRFVSTQPFTDAWGRIELDGISDKFQKKVDEITTPRKNVMSLGVFDRLCSATKSLPKIETPSSPRPPSSPRSITSSKSRQFLS
ncbi:pcp [Acrasis kona]|uniref:Pcp n=1 Tax=Acrasis kona TaxID=1008807 RepID=A0AAW2ZNP4_9EUKA